MWRLSGELAVNCSTLVDLPRQTHGLRWMRDELRLLSNVSVVSISVANVTSWYDIVATVWLRHCTRVCLPRYGCSGVHSPA